MAANNVDYYYTLLYRVVGDVVGHVYPTMKTTVVYNGNPPITNGATFRPSMAADAPHIEFEGHAHSLYTLLILDPDMPSPSNPTMRDYIHWMVTDIPGAAGRVDQGMEILPYMPPLPQRGIHRYMVLLYEQVWPLGLIDPPTTRANFDCKAFARRHALGYPKGLVYFVAKRESRPRCH